MFPLPDINADKFVPTKWDTAEDKAKFASQFVTFVNNDFARKSFPKWFYRSLSNTFGHIAHYNHNQFFDNFFSSPAGKFEFLNQCLHAPAHGDPEYTYCDVEKFLQNWIRVHSICDEYEDRALHASKAERYNQFLALSKEFEVEL